MSDSTPHPAADRLALAQRIADEYAALPQVEAVTLAGSQSTGMAQATSDLDMYVYVRAPIPLAERRRITTEQASRAEVDNQYWEPGDEWIDRALQVGVDLMFRDPAWIEEQIDRVLVRHEASVGYSTAFWHNVRSSRVLFDRRGWFSALRSRAAQPYPEPLRRAIVAKNHPLLRRNLSSYRHQLESAIRRNDGVSINHRVAALLASYFDILFAINRLPHPGEKRQVQIALDRCARLPAGMVMQLDALLAACGGADAEILARLDALLDGLDALLAAEGLLPQEPADSPQRHRGPGDTDSK